jgi:hypothetical protein
MKQELNAFATGNLKQIGSLIAGAFTVGKITEWTKGAMDAAEKITLVGTATNLTSDQVQTLAYLTSQYGGSVEKAYTAVERLKKAQDSAAGSKVAAKLGMTGEQFRLAPTAQVLESLAKYYKQTGDINTVTQALGRGSLELGGVLKQLADQGFAGATDAAIKFGAVIQGDTLRQLDELQDRMEGIKLQGRTMWSGFVVGAANVWGNVQKALSQAMSETGSTSILDPQTLLKTVSKLAGQGNQSAVEANSAYLAEQNEKLAMQRRQQSATAAQIAEQQDALRAKVSAEMMRGGPVKIESADSFGRVGAFIGAQSNPASSIARQQLEISRRMERALGKIEAAGDRAATALESIDEHTED